MATPLYRAVMVEIERRRLQLGWPAWKLDDIAGTQDGHFMKCLWADTPSGRQAKWETLQYLIEALFPDGFDLEIRVQKGSSFDASKQKSKIRHAAAHFQGGRVLREHMKSLRKKARSVGLAGVGKRRRKQIARAGGKARWRTPKLVELDPKTMKPLANK